MFPTTILLQTECFFSLLELSCHKNLSSTSIGLGPEFLETFQTVFSFSSQNGEGGFIRKIILDWARGADPRPKLGMFTRECLRYFLHFVFSNRVSSPVPFPKKSSQRIRNTLRRTIMISRSVLEPQIILISEGRWQSSEIPFLPSKRSNEHFQNTLLPSRTRNQTPRRRLIKVWFVPSVPIWAPNSRLA